MIKKLVIICVFVIFNLLLFCSDFDQVINDTAQNQFRDFIGKIPMTELSKLGIMHIEDLNKLQLGNSHNLLNINLENDIPDASMLDLSNHTTPTNIWFFSVNLEENTIAMLIVDKVHENWKVVSFGYSSLAREMQQVEDIWLDNSNINIDLLSDNSMQRFYFSISEDNKTNNLTELNISASVAKQQRDYADLSPIGNTINEIRQHLTTERRY